MKKNNSMGQPIKVVQVGFKGETSRQHADRPPGISLEVGKVFKSVGQAEMFTGISKNSIFANLSGRMKHARGIVFERVDKEDQVIECLFCGEKFIKNAENQKFCSVSCQQLFHNRARMGKRRIKKEQYA